MITLFFQNSNLETSLFWSGTYSPTDGRKVKITHVGMYLGIETKDNRAVMICATRGRSYRDVPRDGFGSAPLPEKKGGEKE
ncbi:hypothetical protein N9291_00175 [bacterium]|nr:hypothetical protein [bacterium]MDB4508155.1 hypothetical protein [Akkermansiaceae bacterium]